MHAFECTDDFAGPHRQALFSETAGHPLARVVRAIFVTSYRLVKTPAKPGGWCLDYLATSRSHNHVTVWVGCVPCSCSLQAVLA